MTEVSSSPTSSPGRGLRARRGARQKSARKKRESTPVQRAVVVALGLVGAFVGTIVFLIVLTIIVGVAGGH